MFRCHMGDKFIGHGGRCDMYLYGFSGETVPTFWSAAHVLKDTTHIERNGKYIEFDGCYREIGCDLGAFTPSATMLSELGIRSYKFAPESKVATFVTTRTSAVGCLE